MLSQLLAPHWWVEFIGIWWPWYLTTVLLGWLSFPLLFGWLRSLPDRGYAVSRIIALFLLSYINWILCHRFFSFSTLSLTVSVSAIMLFSARALLRHRIDLWRHVRTRWKWILFTELFAIALFMILINIRSYCSDIQYNPNYHGAEKLGNMMMLTALCRTEKFPVEDSWFCQTQAMKEGHEKPVYLNYYYGGHLQWATMARLVRVPPEFAFNLALATVFSWIGLAGFALMLNLTRRVLPSMICGLLLVFGGNLEPFRQLDKMVDAYEKWREDYSSGEFIFSEFMMVHRFDLWRPSRVILSEKFSNEPQADYTVNEFPYFSFILGDLHAHSSALPLTLSLLVVLLNLFYRKQNTGERWNEAFLREPGAAFLAASLIGGLYFYNAWEIVPLAILLIIMLGWDRNDWHRGKLVHIALFTITGLTLAAIGLLVLFGLFTFTLENPWSVTVSHETSAGFLGATEKIVDAVKDKFILRPHELGSSARELFLFWGLIALPLIFVILRDFWTRRFWLFTQRRTLYFAIFIFLSAMLGLFFSFPGAQICFALVVASALFAWRILPEDESFSARLMLAGFAIVFAAEILVVNDAMTDRLERYNTVFKLYYPAWAILTSTAVYFVWLWGKRFTESKNLLGRILLTCGVIALVSLALIYPFMATWSRTDGFFSAQGDESRGLYLSRPQSAYRVRTLDGLAFLADTTEAPDDLEAIRWINEHIAGRPHVLEAAGQAYNYNGRVAAYTGLPTIIGWDNHEQQWRGWDLANVVAQRKADVATAYSTLDMAEAIAIHSHYAVQYVFIGKLERSTYAAGGLDKFAQLGDLVFENATTKIFDVTVAPGSADD